MAKFQVTSKEVCYLFKGRFIDDEALYELYSELLDTFHSLNSDVTPDEKRTALVELSKVKGEAVRRNLIEGHSFESNTRETLVSQEFSRLRNVKEDMGLPAPVNISRKSTSRKSGQRDMGGTRPGQLSLFHD